MRAAKILLEAGLPGMFFIETASFEAQQQIKELSALGFEIGGHTMTHPKDLKALTAEQCSGEVSICKSQIEKITGKPCTSFAYPRGRFNDVVVEIVKAAGYEDARITHVLKIEAPDQFRMPTTIHMFDVRKEYDGRTWLGMADFYLDHAIKKGGMFYLWGHAGELDRAGQWNMFKGFLKKLKEQVA